jgi:hypothetical protein
VAYLKVVPTFSRIGCEKPRTSVSSCPSSVTVQNLGRLTYLYVRFCNKGLLWGGVVSTTPDSNLEDLWTTCSLAPTL